MAGLDARLAQEVLSAADSRFDQLRRGLPYTAYGVVATVDASTRKASVYVSGDPVASAGFTYRSIEMPVVGELVRVVIDPRGDRYIEAVQRSGGAGSPANYVDGYLRVMRNPGGGRVILQGEYDGESQARMRLVMNDSDGTVYLQRGTGASTPATFLLSDGSVVQLPGTADVGLADGSGVLQVGPSGSPNIGIDQNEIQARSGGVAQALHLDTEGGQVIINQNGGGVTDGLSVMQGGIRLGTSANPGDSLHMLFGADVLLGRQAANILETGAGDIFDAQGGLRAGGNSVGYFVPANESIISGSTYSTYSDVLLQPTSPPTGNKALLYLVTAIFKASTLAGLPGIALEHYTGASFESRQYAQDTSRWIGYSTLVVPGGTNGRQFRLTFFNTGSAPTFTVYVWLAGYWRIP